jgi:gas vesicle protein
MRDERGSDMFGFRRESLARTISRSAMIFVAGAAVGAAVALLYAPKSGRKLQRDLREGLVDLTGRFRTAVEGPVETIAAGVKEAAEAVEEAAKKIRIA